MNIIPLILMSIIISPEGPPQILQPQLNGSVQSIDEEEQDNWERFTLICKPEQSGKTFIMIQQIIRDLTEQVTGKHIINFIFCDNSLLLTAQTGERVKNDLNGYKEANGELYLELSSHSRTDFHNSDSVIGALTTKGVKNVLCCTNGKRIDDIYDIINRLNQSEITRGQFIFKVWLDEADKFDNYIDSTFNPLVDSFDNVYVNCITATPKTLFDKYHRMNVLPIQNTTGPEYHGWVDNDIHLINHPPGDGFVKHVLDNCCKDLIIPDTKWFIPAGSKKKSHNSIKNICVERGIATIIVNGDGISVWLPDLRYYKYEKDKELNEMIKDLYRKHNLEEYPVAITGNICIGRGISILSEDFMIDYGIFSRCNNQQEASQNSGRLKGNIKGWSSYKKPTVFTTSDFDKVAREWEKKSRGLAELAFLKDSEGKSTMITKNEFKTVGKNYSNFIHSDLFPSFASAQRFLQTKVREMDTKMKISKKSVIHVVDGGYKVTSKLLKSGRTVADLGRSDVLTIQKANMIGAQTCISSTDKGSRYLILPVYDDIDSPPNTEKYQVRYISFKQ